MRPRHVKKKFVGKVSMEVGYYSRSYTCKHMINTKKDWV